MAVAFPPAARVEECISRTHYTDGVAVLRYPLDETMRNKIEDKGEPKKSAELVVPATVSPSALKSKAPSNLSPSPLKLNADEGETKTFEVVEKLAQNDAHFWINLLRHQAKADTFRRKSSLTSLASLQLGMHSGSLMSSRGSKQQKDFLMELEELAEQFDQTEDGVSSLFVLFDSGGKGKITHDELRRGLQSQGLLHVEDGGRSFNELIRHVDSDHDQHIDLEEFAACLLRLRLARLHLLGKSMSHLGAMCDLHCVDYDSKTTQMQLPVLRNKQLAFFFNYNDVGRLATRWIHVIGHDDLMLLRLAVKYQFHPMALLDSMQIRQKPPTCVMYGVDFFISFPQMRLTKKSLDGLQQYYHKRSALAAKLEEDGYDSELNIHHDTSLSVPPVHVECEQAPTGIFYMRDKKLLVSFETKSVKLVRKRRDRSKRAMLLWKQWCKLCCLRCTGTRTGNLSKVKPSQSLERKRAHVVSHREQTKDDESKSNANRLGNILTSEGTSSRRLFSGTSNSTSKGHKLQEEPKYVNLSSIKRRGSTVICSVQTSMAYENVCEKYGDNSLLASTLRAFKRKYTMLRRSGIERLLHTILSGIVQNMRPIVDCYHVEIEWYQAVLGEKGPNFDKTHVAALLQSKRELTRLEHTIEPMKKVIDLLLEDRSVFKDPAFFRDVDDSVNAILIDVKTCKDMIDEISDGFQHHHDRRMNDVLYLLTLVTTCVLPMQLLAGIFGMNFTSETAPLGIQDPILRWEWGYAFFWAASLILCVIMSMSFKFII